MKNFMAQNMFFSFPEGLLQSKTNICSCNSCLEGKFVGCSVEIGKAAENSLDDNSSDSRNAEYEHEDCPQILLLILRFLEMVC